jgi:hypothetical protein
MLVLKSSDTQWKANLDLPQIHSERIWDKKIMAISGERNETVSPITTTSLIHPGSHKIGRIGK